MNSQIHKSPVLRYFAQLGTQIDASWGKRRDIENFSTVAMESLERLAPLDHFDVEELIAAIIGMRLGKQSHFRPVFGQPAVTLHHNGDFVVDVYFWRESSPAIHNHPFYGAVTVLSGFSVHIIYDFEESARLDHRLKEGKIKAVGTELLREGDCRRFAGDPIHRLLHIPANSVSMVVRTIDRPIDYYRFLEPGLALIIDREEDDRAARKRELLGNIASDNTLAKKLLKTFIRSADLQDFYELIEPWYLSDPQCSIVVAGMEICRKQHGAKIARCLERAMQFQASLWELEHLRRRVAASDRLLATLAVFSESLDSLIQDVRLLTEETNPLGAISEMMARAWILDSSGNSHIHEKEKQAAPRLIEGLLRNLASGHSANSDRSISQSDIRGLRSRLRKFPMVRKYL